MPVEMMRHQQIVNQLFIVKDTKVTPSTELVGAVTRAKDSMY